MRALSFFVWVIVIGLSASPRPGVGMNLISAEVQLECVDLLGDLKPLVESVTGNNWPEFQAFKQRLLRKSNPKEFRSIFLKLLHTYQLFESRILKSHLYDGKLVAPLFLRGILIWAETCDDVNRAIEIFFHAYDPEINGPRLGYGDNDLTYFAGRTAWMAQRYDQFRNGGHAAVDLDPSTEDEAAASVALPFDPHARHEAIIALDQFDETSANDLHISFDERTFQVKVDGASSGVYTRLARMNIPVSATPVTPLNLHFNNNRRANFDAVLPKEYWAAKYLARVFPDDQWLGLGDLSTRQFFPLLQERDGYLVHFPRSADFLTVSQVSGRWIFNIRELKFTNPHNQQVDIQRALEQLESTWTGLVRSYGVSAVGSPRLEVVIPRRASRSPDLKNGYALGNYIGATHGTYVDELLYQGNPVVLQVDGYSSRVAVRQLKIEMPEYRQLLKDSGDSQD